MITTELIMAGAALLISFMSLLISIYFNKRTLKQSDVNLKTQLLYDDLKKSIFKLNDVIDTSKTYNKFCENIKKFLDSNEGQFIPNEIIKEIRIGMSDLDKFDSENDPSIPPGQDEYIEEQYQEHLKEQEEIDKLKEPYEIFEEKFNNKLHEFKSKIKKKSKEKLKNIK